MATEKQLKLAQKVASQQQAIVAELQAFVGDIERTEKTFATLKTEMETANSKHANRSSTQEYIEFLEDMLACAKKKLVWEKQMASLQKRTPDLMQRVEVLVNHPESNPDKETQDALLGSLRAVQDGIRRLNEIRF